MKLYLVRHGETEGNPRHVYQDGSDPLSEKGKEQAAILTERFKSIPIDGILASPYIRAQQTIADIAAHHNLPITNTELVQEKRWPSELLGKSALDPEIAELKKILRAKEYEDPDWHHSDEESFVDIKTRCLKFLDYAANLHTKHQRLLVASHAHFLKLLLCVMIYGEATTPHIFRPFFGRVSLHNTGITVCEYYPNATDGHNWHILTLNDHAHLGDYHQQPHM